MSLEKRVKQEDCKHAVLRYDGKMSDGEGGFVELYTCTVPKGVGVEWCGGTFSDDVLDGVDGYRDLISDNKRYLVRRLRF